MKIITLPIRLMFHHFIWDGDHNEKKISCHYIIPQLAYAKVLEVLEEPPASGTGMIKAMKWATFNDISVLKVMITSPNWPTLEY